jgi:hypothetical protein
MKTTPLQENIMDFPAITKVISVDNTLTPWEKARLSAEDTTPEFHWKHKITMYHNIRKALGYEAIWSIDSVTHFDDIAFEGYIVALHYDYYGDSVVTVGIDKVDPTWFDIYKACNDAIIESHKHGNHHLFIEIVNRTEDRLHLFTGS